MRDLACAVDPNRLLPPHSAASGPSALLQERPLAGVVTFVDRLHVLGIAAKVSSDAEPVGVD